MNSTQHTVDKPGQGCVHLIKLCVGVDSVETLSKWQEKRIRSGFYQLPEHVTRMRPRRAAEILNGGSLYWVMRGLILARQRILALETRQGEDQISRCAIVLERQIFITRATPRRAFRGWRYLEVNQAPRDIRKFVTSDKILPREIEIEIDRLGVI